MSNIIDENAPLKSKIVKKKSVPYMNSKLRKAQFARNMSRNKFRRFGKSHWEGGLHNGKFNKESGQATNELARMWMKLCERYATRGNVRGYTYNDEMQGQAILQLAQIGLQFDESKSNNPYQSLPIF